MWRNEDTNGLGVESKLLTLRGVIERKKKVLARV
jgi:hypothetical protein